MSTAPTPAARTAVTLEPEESPIFLVGAERSGTTLFRLMLDHHPEIAFLPEFDFSVEHVNGNALPQPEWYYDWVRDDFAFRQYGLDLDASLAYPQLQRSFLKQKRERDGKQVVGATVHKYFDRLPRIWPQARYIHIIRDGRDVARSAVQMGWAGNAYTGADVWIEAERTWQRLKPRLTQQQYIEVHYEDLVSNAEAELSRVCRYFGLAFHPDMFDYVEHTSYGIPDAKLAHQWRRKLNDKQVRLLESRIGDMLVRRGYALSGLPRVEPTAVRRAMIRAHSRVGRLRFHIRRYGMRLYLLDLLGRRLHLTPLQRHVRPQMNDVLARHIRR